MVRLGISKSSSSKNSTNWDEKLIEYNKMQMVKIFLASIDEYNDQIVYEEEVDQNGVHIAKQLLKPEDFKLIVGYHEDLVTDDVKISTDYGETVLKKITTTIYTNLLIGYSRKTMTIVIIEVSADLSSFGEMYVFHEKDILKTKYSWFLETFQIFDKSESVIENVLTFLSNKNRTTFLISAGSKAKVVDEEGRVILVYMRQEEEREDFLDFFKNFKK